MAECTFNTKLRNPGVRPGSHWVSPRAVSWVWGCRPPSLVVLSSISRHLFQEPCTLGGHLTGSFPPILHPSPPIFKPFFRLYFPSTIWTLIPPLLTTSAQVFSAEGVFVRGWWAFLPLPPFIIFGVWLAVVAARLLSALSFLLFFCAAFPSTVFHPSFSTGAVVVGASGRVVS
jgi:hypothetical protein